MVPLNKAAARHVRSWLGAPAGPGLLALHHALDFPRPGLWGDDPKRPTSVLLIRDGDDRRREAFGAGDPGPAVGWLAGMPGRTTLGAPAGWEAPFRAAIGAIERGTVHTYHGLRPEALDRPAGPARTRRLALADVTEFEDVAPPWALRGWMGFDSLVAHGAAFGVPDGRGFAALAWVFDQAGSFDAIGVFTVPRFRRLGLGRAAAFALIAHIVGARARLPVWSTPAENGGSQALAAALGFASRTAETLLRWPPGA